MIFKRWRQRSKLAKGIREVAKQQFALGDISIDQYERLLKGSQDKETLERTLKQLEVNEDALGAIDWTAIKDWILANWPTILRIMLTVVMLLDPQDE